MTTQEWIEFATPIAVGISIALQKMQSRKVKLALEEAAAKSNFKLTEIHKLVDGGMSEQKHVGMVQAQRIADLTQDPADLALAIDAQHIYMEHIARMKRVDWAVGEEAAGEHRLVLTDGPLVKTLLERMEIIESLVKDLPCSLAKSLPCAAISKDPTLPQPKE